MNKADYRLTFSILLGIVIIILSVQCSSKFAHGERAYLKYCGDCHMEDGQGVGEIYPSLLTSRHSINTEILPCIIKHGYNDSTTVMQMNPIEDISDIDITNIINYVTIDLLGKQKEVLIQDIQNHLKTCNKTPVN